MTIPDSADFTEAQRKGLRVGFPAIDGWAIAYDGRINPHTFGATREEALTNGGFYHLETFLEDMATMGGGIMLVPVRVEAYPAPVE
jgi:hypothetical protein